MAQAAQGRAPGGFRNNVLAHLFKVRSNTPCQAQGSETMTLSNIIFKISPRLHLWYCFQVARFRYGPISHCIMFCYMVKLGWRFLTGRMLLITVEDAESNGGYKYFVLVLSKRPVSALNTYEDLK